MNLDCYLPHRFRLMRFLRKSLLILFVCHSLEAAVTCNASATPAIVLAEGVAERLGDIVLDCTGAPNDRILGNLNLFLNVNVTNHLTAQNNLDAGLTVDQGSGPVTAGSPAQLSGTTQASFNGIDFPIPP